MPYVQQVAVGRRPALTVLGNDYATRDGTELGIPNKIVVNFLSEFNNL
ncbi:hypothetical protein ZEAMMB73_Zm00001d051167 [Zea mays]|uniref:Uncharacterized protein n=1 Tax=Zea mays TaxID=4577 RepID=A0A1D6Q5C0_MAIZE|nr:hypothetical protein ZEAMMB73_Zm00001d051167 [Zea mays]